jgi:hypothetical protein
MNIDGNSSQSTFTEGVISDKISDLSESSIIELDESEINITTTTLKLNGDVISTVASAIQNPLVSTLDAGAFNISNVNTLSANRIENNNATSSLTLNTPYATFSGNTRVAGELIVNNGVFIDGTPSQLITRSITILADRHENRKFGGMLNANTIYTDSVFANDNTNSNNLVALMRYSADENHTSLARGTDIGFFTTLRGSITPTERLTIDADGITKVSGNFQTSLNTESKTYSENAIPGELVKRKNNNNFYAGTGAGANLTTGTNNVLYGLNAGGSLTTQTDGIGIGNEALKNVGGNFNVAIGGFSQRFSTGEKSVSVGWGSLFNAISTSQNSCLGHFAGGGLISGSNNVLLGYNVNADGNSNGSTNSVAIGHSANSDGGLNRVVIGSSVIGTKNNQVILGNASAIEIINAGNNTCDLGSTTNQFKELYINQINGLTPSGGVYMTTSNSTAITATLAETSLLLGATFAGSLAVPANTFQIASYHLNLSGEFSSANGDTLTLKIKTNATILSTFVINLTGTVGEFYELEGDFSIRKLGVAGVSEISGNFDFSYSDTVVFLRGSRECVVNTTTFDTTISNSLDATAQFSSNNASNRIQTLQAILTRIY